VEPVQKQEGVVTISELNSPVELVKQASESESEKIDYDKILESIIESKPWVQ
jgi:hypothetical protein